MKNRKSFFIYGAPAAVLAIAATLILFSRPGGEPKFASCAITGYTNRSGTNLVLLQVTNQSRMRLVCFVEPPMITTKNGELKLNDVYPAANAVFMSPHEAFTFQVRCSTDTNLLYVRFDLEETSFGLPRWRRVIMNSLRATRLPLFRPKICHLQSPPFGQGKPEN